MREQVRSQKEPADGTEGTHGVHDADVHGRVVPLDVVVDVGGAQGEEGRAAATEEKLGNKCAHVLVLESCKTRSPNALCDEFYPMNLPPFFSPTC